MKLGRKTLFRCVKVFCMIFVFSIFFNSSNVFAEAVEISDLATLTHYFANGGEVKLISDITVTSNQTISSILDIDLNGHTINLGKKDVSVNADLTVRDTSAEQDGKIYGNNTSNYYFLRVDSVATLTLESGSLISTTWGINNQGTIIVNGGEITGNYLAIANDNTIVINNGVVTGQTGMAIKNNKTGSSTTINGGLVQTLDNDSVAINNGKPYSTIIVNGGSVEARQCASEQSGGSAIVSFKDTEVIINGGTLASCSSALLGNGSDSGSNEGTNAKFTVNGGTITSEIGAGIYAPQVNGVTTINDGTITGVTGIEIRAGTLNVLGGTVTGTGDYEQEEEYNGLTTKGAAISVAQHTTDQPISVSITGGNMNAKHPVSTNDETKKTAEIKIVITGGEYEGEDYTEVVDNTADGYVNIDEAGKMIVVPEEDIVVPDTGTETFVSAQNTNFDILTQIITITLFATPFSLFFVLKSRKAKVENE